MDIEEKREKLEFMQHFFFKSFIISFFFLLLGTWLCVLMHDFQFAFVQKYFAMEADDFNELVILMLGIWKILIFQFTLVPALAIFCMRKCCKCCCNSNK